MEPLLAAAQPREPAEAHRPDQRGLRRLQRLRAAARVRTTGEIAGQPAVARISQGDLVDVQRDPELTVCGKTLPRATGSPQPPIPAAAMCPECAASEA